MSISISKTRPKIWYIHPYSGGPGVGRYMRPYSLAKHWQRLGVDATVFASANHHQLDNPRPPGREIIDGVSYEFIPCRRYEGSGLKRILNMLDLTLNMWRLGDQFVKKYGRPDAIISSSPHPYVFLAGHRLAKKYRARSVFEVRDLWPLSFVELLGLSKYHPLVLATDRLERFAYRNADAVISLLPLTKPYMVEHGLAPEKWHYIPNGIESATNPALTKRETPCSAILKARELKAAGYTVIVYTGGLGRPNVVDSLVKGMAAVRKISNLKVAAIIVGRGEMQENIREEITALGLEHVVFLFDQITKSQTLSLLSEVDVGYFSLAPGSLFRFGVSPNKLFDYMNAGLPIISCLNAGNDTVQESQCGISIKSLSSHEIANAIIKLSQMDSSLRHQLGENGKAFVQRNHSYANLASEYLKRIYPNSFS